MEERTITQIKPTEFTLDALDHASDQQLADLIGRATTLLEKREKTRKSEALAQIKALAKAHGLNIAVEPRARRGRKPKAKTD